MKPIFPYPTLVGGVGLEVVRVSVDQIDLPVSMFSTNERVVALHQIEGRQWRNVVVTMRVTPPPREMEQGPWHNPSVGVIAREKATNFRLVTPLNRDPNGSWVGRVILDHGNHLAAVDIEAAVAATIDGVPGRWIGGSEQSWRIDLLAKTPTRQSHVNVVAADFGAPEHSFLEPFKDDPWAIGLSATAPVVYVNTRIEGLWSLLSDGDADKGLPSVISAQIASETWTTMLHMALQTVDVEDGIAVWPGGWQENVIRRMVVDIFPDRSPDDGLRALTHPSDVGDLQTRIVHAAGRQAQLTRRLGTAIRAAARSSAQETL